MNERYEAYLNSDWWKQTADRIKERASHKCEVCGRPFDLHVHHKTYEHVGFERDYELVCLCRNCHKKIEEFKKENNLDLNEQNYLIHLMQQDIEKQRRSQECLLETGHDYTKNGIYPHRYGPKYYDFRKHLNEFIQKYKDRDYCNHGDLNLCNRDVIKKCVENFFDENNYPLDFSYITIILDCFRNERYRVIIKYREQGASDDWILSRYKFSRNMMNRTTESMKKLLSMEEN